MIRLYGIKNCDTVKKARQWLDTRCIAYDFHDYKTQGLSQEQLNKWVAKLGWQPLINTRGTTWRQLTESEKAKLDNEQSAIELLLQKTSLLKRPLVEVEDELKLGFSELNYQQWFSHYESG